MKEGRGDFGFRLPPASTDRPIKHNRETQGGGAMVENTVPLPRELVDEVVINPLAKQMLSPKFKDLFDPDFLISIARLTAPWSSLAERARRVLVVREWGRAIPLLYGKIPYGEGLIGTFVSAKGTLISGKYYRIDEEDIDYIKVAHDPIGFFGDSDARKEVTISNDLLERGTRSSLSLAYLVINEHLLEQFINQTWSVSHPKIGEALVRGLNIVSNNHDRPTLLFRVGGTPERIGSHLHHDDTPIYFRRKRAAISRGAGILREELLLFPNYFQRYSGDILEAKAIFETIFAHKQLSPFQFDGLIELLAGIVATEARAIATIDATKYRIDPNWAFLPRDHDYTFCGYDYEMWLWPQGHHYQFVSKLSDQAVELICVYLNQLKVAGFLPPNVVLPPEFTLKVKVGKNLKSARF